MSSPHDRGYFPPIPVLSVKFGRSGERPWLGPFEAIVDTGADTTILPDSVVEQLKITPINPGQLVTQWGDVHPVNIYLLDIEVEEQRIPGTIVAGDAASKDIVLGRSLLNHLSLFIDGPLLQTEVLSARSLTQLRAHG